MDRERLIGRARDLLWERSTRTLCQPHHFEDVERKWARFENDVAEAGYDLQSVLEAAQISMGWPA